MNVRRSIGLFHSSACWGYSRTTNSRNTGLSASSSRLRQYCLPLRLSFPSCIARIWSRISWKFMCRSLSAISNFLTVTSRTTRQHLPTLNLVFSHQFAAQVQLVLTLVLRTPGHIEDFSFRPDKPLRCTVTLQTPLHLQ